MLEKLKFNSLDCFHAILSMLLKLRWKKYFELQVTGVIVIYYKIWTFFKFYRIWWKHAWNRLLTRILLLRLVDAVQKQVRNIFLQEVKSIFSRICCIRRHWHGIHYWKVRLIRNYDWRKSPSLSNTISKWFVRFGRQKSRIGKNHKQNYAPTRSRFRGIMLGHRILIIFGNFL